MFVLTTISDTVRIPPPMFVQPIVTTVHQEIEKKYPNRVIMDLGLVICRYGDVLEIGDGLCVAGDGGAHYEVAFRLVIFRPFVEEVCVGQITESNEEGVRVSLGNFFHDIFIPAYWMLNPSQYDSESMLWVWTPKYDDDDNEEEEAEERFEMEIGSEIRFKVKAINFTQVTNTAKGVQATTTSTASSKLPPGASEFSGAMKPGATGGNDSSPDGVIATNSDKSSGNTPVRRRSSSVDLSDSSKIPASMHITASICDDGLGLVSWWSSQEPSEQEEYVEDEMIKGES